MDVSNIASLSTGMAQQRNDMDVSVAVFKKSMDVQSSMALALINSITQTPATALPAHLGNKINTTA